MAFRSTYRPQIGPFKFNTGMHGLTSVTMRMFGVTYRIWSKKSKSGIASVDLPGPLSYRPKAAKKTAKKRATPSQSTNNQNDQD